MPDQTTDRDTTWILNGDNQTWTLTKNATIWDEASPYGINDDAVGSEIRVFGTVIGSEVSVAMGSSSASLHVARSGYVLAGSTGVEMHEDGGRVFNHGSIQSSEWGIYGKLGTVDNFGLIESDTGIEFDDGGFVITNSGWITAKEEAIYAGGSGTIRNSEGAHIVSENYGVYLHGDLAVNTIVNEGIIKGDVYAIFSAWTVDIKNTGAIIGDISLGNGADRIDTRGGIVRGEIYGGGGDDLYLVSSSRIRIVDNGASFDDTVRSTASFTLTGGLDHLTLLGNKDVDGTCNIGANDIRGNTGDNRLAGGVGDDRLSGGAGNDRLIGGADADTFVFARGFDVDRIMDFTDGVDLLDIVGVTTRQQFGRLDIRQAGQDVIIDLGHGDRLIIEDFSKGALGYDDISVS